MSISSMDHDAIPIIDYPSARPLIRSGDILLASGNSLFSNLIQSATHSIWSHVAFVLRVDSVDRVMVLESVESLGVRVIPLRNYLYHYNGATHGYEGKLLVARHQAFDAQSLMSLSHKGIDYLGYPYNTEEILRIAARIGMTGFGLKVASELIQPQREFICSEYVAACFAAAGIIIPYDPLGFIAPVDFANCEAIIPITYLRA